MNSIVLLVWLVLPNGQQQVLRTDFFNTESACMQAGQAQVETQARQGRKVVFKCHVTQLEYTGDDIDTNGNIIAR